ncbi:AraC family transcriptional regulator [Acidisarcina polymorpha]|uniref:AraC family transcriptional regulator n=1 Tax=Acidisarcina polymorpha TaxID=2211140 RepID=UPI0039C870C2
MAFVGTDIALADVALRCGFADQAHLAKVFRHRRQISPSAYRRLARSQRQNLC